ncbi:hypothetical protein D3C74_49620 [compost metagenome]
MTNEGRLNNDNAREIAHERVRLAAAYWLEPYPRERTEADGVILARYARKAMKELEEKDQLIAALQKELEYYADEKTYSLSLQASLSMGSTHAMHEPIKYDKGARARKVLGRE